MAVPSLDLLELRKGLHILLAIDNLYYLAHRTGAKEMYP